MAEFDTKIRIRADASEIKKAGQAMRQAFSPKDLREFRNATRDVERQLAALTRTQIDLSKKLTGVERGTKAYRALNAELKEINKQATQAKATLGNLDRLQRDADSRQKAKALVGRSFGAGLAQGLGVSEYIPADRGMAARIGGNLIGSGIRRAAGAVAAPFMTPGIGGLTTGLQGIPLVGGFAAGAVQTAAAAYQSAVQYDRARMNNLYLSGEPGKVQAMVDNPEYESKQKAFADLQEVRRQSQNRRIMRIANRGARKVRVGFGMASLVNQGDAARASDKVARDSQLDRVVAEAAADLRNTPKKVGKLVPGDPLVSAGFGTDLGYSPMQVQQMLGAFGGVSGTLAGRGAGRRAFNEALAAKSVAGISMEQAGLFTRMSQAGGGGQGNVGLSKIIANAMVMGLKGSQIPEYLQSLVSLGKEAEARGVKINESGILRQGLLLKRAGLQGPQIAKVTAGLNQRAMGVSERGVQSPMDVEMLRAAGFDPTKGPESYAEAIQRLEGGVTPEIATRLFERIGQGARGAGGPAMQALLARRALGRVGVRLGARQALSLAEKVGSGGAITEEDLRSYAQVRGRGMAKDARSLMRRGAPTAGMSARGEALRIGVGRANTWVQGFENNMLQAAGVVGNFTKDLSGLSKQVGSFIQSISKFTQGGVDGIFIKISQLFKEMALNNAKSHLPQ